MSQFSKIAGLTTPQSPFIHMGYSSLPCADWDYQYMIDFSRKNGFDYVELRQDNPKWVSINNGEKKCNEIHNLFLQNNLKISDIGSSVVYNGIGDYSEKLVELKKTIEIAKLLNAKGVRIFLGNFFTRKSSVTNGTNVNKICEFLKLSCSIAYKMGVEIWIETHNEFSTGETLRPIIKEVDMPNLKIIWDIIHPLEYKENIVDTYNLLSDYIVHLHIKDGVPYDDDDMICYKYTEVGEGICPIKDIVALLIKNKHKCCCSLEWETVWRKELQYKGSEAENILPKYLKYMTQIINEVQNENFNSNTK
jgi:sugar phosphate isomerase/epimerase